MRKAHYVSVSTLLLFTIHPVAYSGQSGSEDQKAIAAAKTLAGSIERCQRREVVAKFSKEWVKEAWGPPKNVTFDVERTSSLVRPYKIFVSFSLTMSYGPHRKTRDAAAADAELQPLMTGAYRNIYSFGEDGTALEAIQASRGADSWVERPRWPDACWDAAPAKPNKE